ncbi:mannose-1-phosphate guanylyltransferase/mannose-6-phosphate isomerase [Pseudomonas deceptionensis]|uniref:Alginate biosynthesis protein AlgA n=1 Tax=Pseudomonas deceptionensis TaxID=882211 RepID=A0A0J6JBP9_PSEDM|nr:mannose-1-phosphate guanylyltransferase/mannose-6-phosphate isomerase [Pseudomonas deceptionensis]KMM81277.1 mannose-1-phosphate guanylyltransferase [Pseudomonas deceptionensis]SEE79519.1 mannose-1-phosphate guanylyltransferase (GDP) /mannose-6-phosphate isomerase, type 2 [Pseudomonas deceptionensis]
MSTLVPCIIAGGAGTRLWPVSREALPKPFMCLPDGESLLQKTFRRAIGLEDVGQLLTVTNRDVFFRTLDEYRPMNSCAVELDFILEPFGRNTAPAIAAAALHVARRYGEDAHLLVLPADHLITDIAAFASAVDSARRLADQGWLVTFGLLPTRAETGFGYIEKGQALGSNGFTVAQFVEKPDTQTARHYLDGGRHLWNSGMFCMRADSVLAEFKTHAPQVLDAVIHCLEHSQAFEGKQQRHLELDSQRFAQVPDISIDYALMEHSQKVAVVPCQLGWSDIGSWEAVRQLSPADANGNQCNGENVLYDVHNCYIDSPKRLVGGVGLNDLIIIDTADALLVADARRSQDVRHIAEALKRQGHDAYRLHRTVTRPWGTYTVLEEGPGFKIKRIVVKPEAALSLQVHQHRSEHWIVVSGTAQVTNGELDFALATNESTFIKPGSPHRLSNAGQVDLVMIEVQSGEYVGEDDIVRLTDIYGRAPITD